MDALKKAELAKRQSAKDKAGTPDNPSLELSPLDTHKEPFAGEEHVAPAPGARQVPGPEVLPELPSSLELLDQEFMDEAAALAQRKLDNTKEPVAEKTPATTAPAALIEPTPALAGRAAPRNEEQTRLERQSAQNLFEAKQNPASKKTTAIIIGLFGLMGAVAIGIYFWLQLQPHSSLMPASGNLAMS